MNKGRITTTSPLRTLEEVERVRLAIRNDPRASALFALGINSALRSTDLLGLKKSDLRGNELIIRERKTRKLRRVRLNAPTVKAIQLYLSTRTDDYEWMFVGLRGRLTHGYLAKLVKTWFATAGINDRQIAGHSMRKTWVRLQHDVHRVQLTTLMYALNHSSERQTLTYMGLLPEDIEKAYQNAL